MNGDVNIGQFLIKFLLVLMSFHPLTPVVASYCPDNCVCSHGQLVCGGAIRRGPEVEEIIEIPTKLDAIEGVIQIGNFSRNFITKIETASFLGLERARILDLSHNSITTIADGAFRVGTTSIQLRMLYLAHNHLQELRPAMFQGLGNLWQLYIGYNRIKVIEVDALNNMPDLHMISLRNSLKNWDYSTRPFESLRKLKMVYLAQTVINSCSCGLLDLFDDVTSRHISIMDETDARAYCSRGDVTCATRRPMTTFDHRAAGIMAMSELIPPVSSEGVITFNGKSHPIITPEGKHLLKLYDMDIRRKIGGIRQRGARAKYEHRFRSEMRKVIQKYFHAPSNVEESPEVAEQGVSTTQTIDVTPKKIPRLPSSTNEMINVLDESTTAISPYEKILNPYEHVSELLSKGFAKYKHKPRPVTTEAPEAPVIEIAPTGYFDIGIIMALVLISIAVSFFATAVAIGASLGWNPNKREGKDLLNDEPEDDEPGCFGKITRKLAVRKKYLDSRGRTSPPKGTPFSSIHQSAKNSIEEKRLKRNLSEGPLPEEAIEALTREQRRRTLGGTSHASSEFTAFDSESDSDNELFMQER